MSITIQHRLRAIATIIFAAVYTSSVWAAAITPEMQRKIDSYKMKAGVMATDPVLVKSIKEANAKGAVPGMENTKWEQLPENNPVVSEMVSNAAGQLLTKWMNEDSNGLNKLVLTGSHGQRFAFTSKPASYMSKDKTHFSESFSGQIWQMKESQPDPSTKVETVQITVPVRDAGQVIGVLLLSLTADNLRK